MQKNKISYKTLIGCFIKQINEMCATEYWVVCSVQYLSKHIDKSFFTLILIQFVNKMYFLFINYSLETKIDSCSSF